jgi:Uma2 family endonuclease
MNRIGYKNLVSAQSCLLLKKNLKAMSMIVEQLPVAIESDYEIEREKPMPDLNHSIVQLNLGSELRTKYKNRFRFLSEINLQLPNRERVPDLAIFPPIQFRPTDNEIRMPTPPLCAIEILSEMQSPHELMIKRTEYFAAGVKSYWLVLPSLRTVHIFNELGEYETFTHKDILKDPLLDIELDLKEVFS